MRICHVSPHLPPDQAANALLPAELGSWQSARGHVISYVTQPPSQGGTAGGSAIADGLFAGPVERVRGRSRSWIWRALRFDALARTQSIVDALNRTAADADILHLHSNGLIIEVAAAWAARQRKPFLLTLYGTEIWHYKPRWPVDPFTRAYTRADAVTFYSRGLLDHARANGLDRNRLSVVYPAVRDVFGPADPETREVWRTALGIAEPHVVLNVKRLHPLAGQQVLIEAFAAIARARDDVRLVICGTGPLRSALEREAARHRITQKVTFTGLVRNADVARYAAVADVFALPSRLEALPTVAIEALAAGTPVVSADHPGGVELHELFGDDCVVVPRENAAALAQALTAAIERPRRTSSATADAIRARFSPAAVESAYAAVYDECRSIL